MAEIRFFIVEIARDVVGGRSLVSFFVGSAVNKSCMKHKKLDSRSPRKIKANCADEINPILPGPQK